MIFLEKEVVSPWEWVTMDLSILCFLVFQTEGFFILKPRKECEGKLEKKVKFAEEKIIPHERQILFQKALKKKKKVCFLPPET